VYRDAMAPRHEAGAGRGLAALLVFAGCSGSGCGGDVVVDGGGASLADTVCGEACSKAEEACPDIGVWKCTKLCERHEEECGEAYRRVTECIVDAEDPVICGPGKGVPASCLEMYSSITGCPSGG
jgi:hypothetical protein